MSLNSDISLEIPHSPLAVNAAIRNSRRSFKAQILRVTHEDGYHLLGVQFANPIAEPVTENLRPRRKLISSV